MKFLSLFAGIGGFDLGLERAGMTCVGQVEIDPYCRAVLAKHWPAVKRMEDIRDVKGDEFELPDVICGGFPCTDISVAGRGAGLDGEFSGLWYEFYRLIRAVRPRFVVLENSAALLFRGIGTILGQLADVGYDAEWRVFSAYEFGAPHERERLYLVSYPNQVNGRERLGAVENWTGKIFKRCPSERLPIWLQAASRFIGVDDGISSRSYANRVGALGNAVVPQIAEVIGRAIMQHGRI